MRLRDGTEHELVNTSGTGQYQVSTFTESELPLAVGAQDDPHIGHSDTPILAMSNRQLFARARAPGGRWYMIELNKRFAYPAACIVLMLIGVPLGMSSRRGGKSAGFVLSIALVFIYYFLFSTGVALAREGKVPVFAGVWSANILFALLSLLLLRRMAIGGGGTLQLANLTNRLKGGQTAVAKSKPGPRTKSDRHGRGRFPLILDDYILREFIATFVMVLVSFVMLMLVFTFFRIARRHHSQPYSAGHRWRVPDQSHPQHDLHHHSAGRVGVGAGHLRHSHAETNELTAMKATGISLYRVMVPYPGDRGQRWRSLFSLFDESYLPTANRRQEALRSVIKGRPAQTFFCARISNGCLARKQPGKPGRIFYYQFFDPDHDRFANISVL